MGTVGQLADGRWQSRYTVVDGDGHRVRKAVYGRTKREAEDRLIDALRDRNRGALAVTRGRGPTLGEHAEAWLAGATVRCRPRTVEKYRQLLAAHVLPSLGSVPLPRLEVGHVNRLLATKSTAGLAPATVAGVRTVLRAALEAAVRQGTVMRNVAAMSDAPRLPDPQRPALTQTEAGRLLAAAETDPEGALWTVAVTTGLRLSELLGLRWDDVDAQQQVLRVERSLQRVNGTWLLSEPKTRRARRAVPLAPLAVAALDRQRARQAGCRLLAGSRWQDEWGALVFTGPRGEPRFGPAIARHLRRQCAALGLPNVGMHGLRRTAASLLADSGVPIQTVGDYLGDGVVTTLKHYVRSVPGSRRRAADTLDALLTASPPAG